MGVCVAFSNLTMFIFVHFSLYTLTYLLTVWSWALLEKLTGSQPLKKLPTLYGAQKFITTFTSARHLSLSWANSIQSMLPTSHFLNIHLNIILPSTPGSSKWSLSFRFPTKAFYKPLLSPIHAKCPAHLFIIDLITKMILDEQYRALSSSLCSFLHSPVTSSLLGPNILLWEYDE